MPQFQHECRQWDACEVPSTRPGLAQLVKFGVELHPSTLCNPLELAQEMLIRLAVPVCKEQVVVASLLALPAIVDCIHQALTDFDRAGLVMFAIHGKDRSCQVAVAAPVSLVVTHHGSNEEVEQKSVFNIGMPVERTKFIVCVSDDLLLVILRLLVLLKELRYAELL